MHAFNLNRRYPIAGHRGFDHTSDVYVIDGDFLAIRVSGFYTIAELEEKIATLKEANGIHSKYKHHALPSNYDNTSDLKEGC